VSWEELNKKAALSNQIDNATFVLWFQIIVIAPN
jgi:hypothetical protein